MLKELIRICRFLTVGLLNTGFGYASYSAIVFLGAPLWMAVAGSTVLGIVFNFYSYGGLVFNETSRHLLPRFLIFYAALGSVNFLALRGVAGLGVSPYLAQAIMLPVLAAGGYFGLRAFVFTRPNADLQAADAVQAE